MVGQMCWLSKLGKDGEKILHLKTQPNESWLPYTACPNLLLQITRFLEAQKVGQLIRN